MSQLAKKPFAEIIESSLEIWQAQCWQWDQMPSFGALVSVQIETTTAFGITCAISTGSIDPHRIPFTYQKTHQELKTDHPQIFELLRTTFSCIPIGYRDTSRIVYQLPHSPPCLHAFVQLANTADYQEFFSQHAFLPLLFNHPGPINNLDELLLAMLHHATADGQLTSQAAETFADQFTLLSGNDYRRLKLFLYRAQQYFTL